MLESLFTNNEGEDIQIYAIIDEDVTEDDKKGLDDIACKHHVKQIVFKTFTEDVFNIFPKIENTHVNKATYYRLFAATLLPMEVKKILYLDGDIIVMDRLRSLWETNLEGISVAGVINQAQSFDFYNRLHYPSKLGYINGGVLLINLHYWREKQVERRLVDFILNYPERIKYWDQDVVNYVLQNERIFLPLKYNVQQLFYFKPEFSKVDYWSMETDILEAQANPVILHFTGGDKPWYIDCKHPKANNFLYYKKRTIWANKPLIKERQTWKQKVVSMGRVFFELLHILPRREDINKYVEDNFN